MRGFAWGRKLLRNPKITGFGCISTALLKGVDWAGGAGGATLSSGASPPKTVMQGKLEDWMRSVMEHLNLAVTVDRLKWGLPLGIVNGN